MSSSSSAVVGLSSMSALMSALLSISEDKKKVASRHLFEAVVHPNLVGEFLDTPRPEIQVRYGLPQSRRSFAQLDKLTIAGVTLPPPEEALVHKGIHKFFQLIPKAIEDMDGDIQALLEKGPTIETASNATQTKAERSDWRGKIGTVFYPVFSLLVQSVASQLLEDRPTILEIGSGFLDEKGRSYLSGALPEEIEKRLIYSDVNPQAVQLSSRMKLVDLTAKESLLEPESLNGCIGCSVLDTLGPNALFKAVSNIYAALKEGGYLLHFSDMQPFVNSLFASLENDTMIVFPLAASNHTFFGAQLLSKAKWNEIFASVKESLSPDKVRFLEKYTNLRPAERFAAMQCLQRMGCLFGFSEWIATYIKEFRSTVFPEDYFHNRMKLALQAAGFRIVHIGPMSKQLLLELKDVEKSTQNNFLMSAWGTLVRDRATPLCGQWVLVAMSVHVFIAKKWL